MAGLSRRRFLASSAALGAAALWSPVFRVSLASAQASCPPPPSFPHEIPLFQQCFANWSGEISVDDLWTCEPRSPDDVATLANWAVAHGYTLRARGFSHNWSPIHVTAQTSACSRVVLLDMTAHIQHMRISSSTAPAVTVGVGASMGDLLTFLERRGYGMSACPAPGELSVGGVLAVGGHGGAVPAIEEARQTGQTFGSMSNRVLSLTAVVWDRRARRYVLRTFERSHPHMRALLVSLGRTIVTEVTLQVEANHNLRCQSFIDIPARELFAPPGTSDRALERFLTESGRVETIWFPYTEIPWLKVWTVAEEQPASSTVADGPYNYAFADDGGVFTELLISVLEEDPAGIVPLSQQLYFGQAQAGLTADDGRLLDLWGLSKNVLLYVRPSTVLMSDAGWVVLTRRRDVQRVVHEFTRHYAAQLESYRSRGLYPITGPSEIRVTGLDRAAEVEHRRAQEPSLSPVVPRRDHPEWDAAVWLSVLTLPEAKLRPGRGCSARAPMAADTAGFYAELERWMLRNYSGSYATLRPEWSKGWAYGAEGPWTNRFAIDWIVPILMQWGRPAGRGWHDAIRRLDALDPGRVFTNPFLDSLLGWRGRSGRGRRPSRGLRAL